MKKHTRIILFACAILALNGCLAKENPLASRDPKEVAASLTKILEVFGTERCSKVWRNPNAANPTVLKSCEDEAFEAASHLKKEGFGDVTSEDIKIPAIWEEYDRQYDSASDERDKLRRKKEKEMFKDVFKKK